MVLVRPVRRRLLVAKRLASFGKHVVGSLRARRHAHVTDSAHQVPALLRCSVGLRIRRRWRRVRELTLLSYWQLQQSTKHLRLSEPAHWRQTLCCSVVDKGCAAGLVLCQCLGNGFRSSGNRNCSHNIQPQRNILNARSLRSEPVCLSTLSSVHTP